MRSWFMYMVRSWWMDLAMLVCLQDSLTNIYVCFCWTWLRESGFMNHMYHYGFYQFHYDLWSHYQVLGLFHKY